MIFVAVVESVYSAVRTDSLYKADYVWSLERLIRCSKGLDQNINLLNSSGFFTYRQV